jgi:4'-phosphopantetheinyl transferase
MSIVHNLFDSRQAGKLKQCELHVWRAALQQSPSVVEALGVVLSQEEIERAERFHFERDRQSFIVSRGILRYLLSSYTSVEPARLHLEYTSTGKPFLSARNGQPDLNFNLSHSGGFVLYAFSHGWQVGIDIEHIRPIEELEQVAESNFSTKEYKELRTVGGEARLKAFFNCWTRKEAFIKALGDGLSFPLQEFDVSFLPDEPARLLSIYARPLEAARWSMVDLQPARGYVAALVVDGQQYSISYRDWSGLASFSPSWS